ncbi:hypothetical protein SynBIOSU31_01254 [Synechococcus sp. BIOS-U3-1]|nr:hypothetical protein SynBIOSU31_01254 [Synechococcus sp. BIOS-U3-1]
MAVAHWHDSCASNRLIHILITSPAKCGVFYVKQVNTVLPVNRCYDC